MIQKPEEMCEECGLPVSECVCCSGCSHVCPMDLDELYCPICLPDPETKKFKSRT